MNERSTTAAEALKGRVNSVRASRDGDQFHYLWAARRCLLLLAPNTDLVAIAVEGASVTSEPADTKSAAEIDEIIDVAEYYGSEDIDQATKVRYAQLKHSTLHANQLWSPSRLEKTLRGFARKHSDLHERLGADALRDRFTFAFISNRAVGPAFVETVEDVAAERPPRHPDLFEKLRRYTALDGERLIAFARALQIAGREQAYLLQRQNLAFELAAYLPDSDADAPIQLKELVTRKALSESAADNKIMKHDVLRALGVEVRDLFPAASHLEELTQPVVRAQQSDIVAQIISAGSHPVLLHAEGGVGKSVFANGLAAALPAGSESIVYDCFGNGTYRSATGSRHPHKKALVQIANELASRGLCHPLIPSPKADPSSYLRAFLHRLTQAAATLRQATPEEQQPLVCIIVDASDNAELAAQELGDRSFARDLIRERIPGGVRIVFVARTHRKSLLDPPPDTVRIPLMPFDDSESAAHLRRSFAHATDVDAAEFHRLTSGNPRVQSLALSACDDLNAVLRSLGPEPATVESSIGKILDDAVSRLKDSVPGAERAVIDTICTAVATLRPVIPIVVLAKMSGVDASAIRSFAFDLGRPLLLADETIRFRDEPAETWFRDRFRPSAEHLRKFVERLKPMATESVYVASELPPLMLQAEMLEELVVMALKATALPDTGALDRRDVELQRLQFALKASLRARRWKYGAKLALKSGTATAGNDRQRNLVQANTDLAGIFMQSDHVLEVVSRRQFGAAWTGSHHAFDAGILSATEHFISEARSHLRMADDWLQNWSRLPQAERQHEAVTTADIAQIALAYLNVNGAQACADWLRGWRPRTVSYSAGRLLAARLVDHARYDDLDALAIAAGNNVGVVLAVNLELQRVGRGAPADAIQRTVALLGDKRFPAETSEQSTWLLEGVVALVVEANRQAVFGSDVLSRLITRYLPPEPPRSLSSQHERSRGVLLRGYALRAVLNKEPLTLMQLAHTELRKEIEESKGQHTESREARELRTITGALLPWCQLWARNVVQRLNPTDLKRMASEALTQSNSARAHSYSPDSFLNNELAPVWFEVALDQPDPPAAALAAFDDWASALQAALWPQTLTSLARRAARHSSTRPHTYAISYATSAATTIETEREHAEATADDLVDVARALLALSRTEARAYFDRAVEVASRVGDENLNRWSALIQLANQASKPSVSKAELAYRFARCAEVTYDYVARDKHFEWPGTVEALAGLCPRSCLAIASRWRDRRFGDHRRVLPLAIEFLTERGDMDARTVEALTGIRAYWNKGRILTAALAQATTKVDRETLWRHALRYARLEPPAAKTWAAFKELQAQYGLPAEDLDEFLVSARRDEAQQTGRWDSSSLSGPDSHKADWDSIFAEADLTAVDGLALAHERFMSGGTPYYRDRFYEEAVRRVPTGGEAEFITAIAALPNFNTYECRAMLESLPPTWRKQRGVSSAVAQVVLGICASHWTEVSLSRYWQALPLPLALEVSGLQLEQIVDVVLHRAGETTELLDSNRMFTIVGLVATKLDDVAAQEALDYGLDQFESVLKEEDGDGPWSDALAPPGDLTDAVAGYLWAGLGDPRDIVRWETAHAVLGICGVGRPEVLARLVHIAAAGSGAAGGGDAFADAKLLFYRYNALQWLVIALLRAATEYPDAVAPHLEFLTRLVLGGEPHVLLRQMAARASLAVEDARPGSLDSSVRARMESVNCSPFPPVVRHGLWRPDNTRDQGDENEDDAFYFGIDIGPYWLGPLARLFGLSVKEVERRARRVIRENWNVHAKSRWDCDERARRGLYDDREVSHSHGGRPRTDNLRFYLSYHAMMVVAGELLGTLPVVQDDEEEDSFDEWLVRHRLTRNDGRWLADRRDPVPLDWPGGDRDTPVEEWPWSLSRADFDAQLFRTDGRVNVWGSWTRIRDYRAETVNIRSALVTPERSRSLLAALQTTTDPRDYGIPDADGDLEISSGGYELCGWIATRETLWGTDDRDPWSGKISFPGPAPSASVTALTMLMADRAERVWQHDGHRGLVSWLWGRFPETADQDEVERGNSLHASTCFLQSLLGKTKKHLVVKVSIERRYTYGRYQPFSTKSYEELGPIPPSARVFLIKGDGHVRTI